MLNPDRLYTGRITEIVLGDVVQYHSDVFVKKLHKNATFVVTLVIKKLFPQYFKFYSVCQNKTTNPNKILLYCNCIIKKKHVLILVLIIPGCTKVNKKLF